MRKVWSHDWIVCPGMRARELSDKGDKSPVALVAALAIKRTEAQSREIASLLSWVAVALIECDEKQVRYCACGNSCAGQEQVVTVPVVILGHAERSRKKKKTTFF